MKTECIDYRKLPGQNSLFLAFLYEFEAISRFYTPIPRSAEDWLKRVDQVLSIERFDRDTLISALEPFNRQLGVSKATLENLDCLGRPDTVAVVTGQQVGYLGGPSYAVYKAATAIQLVIQLRKQGISAVPVFWLAADDSDFSEVRSTFFVNGSGQLLHLEHPDPRDREEQMAGTVPLSDRKSWLELNSSVLESGLPFRRLRENLLDDYRPSRSFREAFACWMTRIFKDYGLIFFDPLLPDYRRGLVNFYRKAITRREDLIEASLARKAELKSKGFQPQVRLEDTETFLFLIQGQNRYKLDYRAGQYRAKGRRSLRFSPDELIHRLEEGSVSLGPNVILRPIVQDYIFPTVVGVTGPSEIAYFSQVNALSGFWGMDLLAYPRAAFTIVDRKSQRLLEKYKLGAEGVLSLNLHKVREKVVRNGSASQILDDVERLRDMLSQRLTSLQGKLNRQDPTVGSMVTKVQEKMLYQLDKVNQRFVTNQSERNEHFRRHVDYLRGQLLPRDHLQERVINFNYFLGEGGPHFIDRLIQTIQPDCLSHRILYL